MKILVWLLVLVCFLAIVASLGSGLYHLTRGGGASAEHSAKLQRALALRIGLSIVLFALLMLAWYFGLITPHSLGAPGAPPR
ncbi:MAG: twin transmembrane helix small protein [Gammaproteobacteria bacterium]|nr:twin transmembrane helix small protein [Gammaproteobacteria bacterium]